MISHESNHTHFAPRIVSSEHRLLFFEMCYTRTLRDYYKQLSLLLVNGLTENKQTPGEARISKRASWEIIDIFHQFWIAFRSLHKLSIKFQQEMRNCHNKENKREQLKSVQTAWLKKINARTFFRETFAFFTKCLVYWPFCYRKLPSHVSQNLAECYDIDCLSENMKQFFFLAFFGPFKYQGKLPVPIYCWEVDFRQTLPNAVPWKPTENNLLYRFSMHL